MRITVDLRPLGSGSRTGIPGYTSDIIGALLAYKAGHQYTLFQNGFRTQSLLTQWRDSANVHIIEKRIPNRLLNLSMRLFNLPRLEKYAPADVIFSPNFYLLPKTKTPRVITFHDLSFLHYPEFFRRKDHVWHQMQQYAQQAAQATHLIAVSEFTKNDLVTLLNIPEGKITVIYPGISQHFIPYSAGDGRLAAYRIEKKLHRPFILYLGSLEPRKNLSLLIRAFDEFRADPRFKGYELVIAGRDGLGAGSLRRLASDLASRSAIRFLGPVTDEERVLLYNCARVFVFPSWFEGFGFPPLEAQCCGVPVIAADRTSLPEILGDSAVLINPWRPGELAQAIVSLETNSDLRSGIIAKGLKNSARFTWEKAAEETLAVLEKTQIA